MSIVKFIAAFLEAVYRERLAIQERGEKIESVSENTRWSTLIWLTWFGLLVLPTVALSWILWMPEIPGTAAEMAFLAFLCFHVLLGFCKAYGATVEGSDEGRAKRIQRDILYTVPVLGHLLGAYLVATVVLSFVSMLLGRRCVQQS